MNKKFFNILVINLVILFFSSWANAEDSKFSQNVADKLIKIATSSSPITKKDYDDFWKSTGIKSKEEKINLISIMRANYLVIQQYNSILWECAEKSWIDNKIYDCQKINKKYLKIRNDLYKLLGDQEFKKVDDNFNKVIKISANREGSLSSNSSGDSITLEKLQYAKNTSKLVLQRVDLIMQVEFR